VAPAFANDEYGDTNPDELSISYFLKKLQRGEGEAMGSVHGYAAAKSADYATARAIFGILAQRGNAQAMTWMSWLDDNGFGAPENSKASAEWDRKAMEAGSHVGTFNFGLDKLRGRGVPLDIDGGKQLIRDAAAKGDETAARLVEHDFDLDVVTPDADNWKYNPYLY
ncbi:MAG: sel1 repeat family protein, partial [Notoacmeibacter sp.]|nr:sel1 repeat family protein [Notoacmeibacter sp.]